MITTTTMTTRIYRDLAFSSDPASFVRAIGLAIVLAVGAAVIIGGIAVFSFLTDPGIEGFWKILISAFYLGLIGLFVSVLRQRLIERKTDKYKDVDI